MSEQKIIEFLERNGPSTPVQIGKYIGVSLLFASAMLSEVASKKLIKITKLKLGSSPLYYLEKDKEKLVELKKHLNPKDLMAFEYLQKEKILRDSELEPITRISLRSIEDFAIKLNIVRQNGSEVFWKWFLLSDEEAKSLIKKKIELENFSSEISKNIIEDVKSESDKKKGEQELKKEIIEEDKKRIIEEDKKTVIEEETKPEHLKKEANINDLKDEIKQKEIKSESTATKKDQQKEINEKITLKESKKELEPKVELEPKEEKDKTIRSGLQGKTKNERTNNRHQQILQNDSSNQKESEKDLNQEFKEKNMSEFSNKIITFFQEKGFIILNYKIETKKSKYSFIISVPNAISKTKYYLKAIDKKTISEGDIAMTIVEANKENLPAIMLITGKITKKLQEKIDTLFKGIVILNI